LQNAVNQQAFPVVWWAGLPFDRLTGGPKWAYNSYGSLTTSPSWPRQKPNSKASAELHLKWPRQNVAHKNRREMAIAG